MKAKILWKTLCYEAMARTAVSDMLNAHPDCGAEIRTVKEHGTPVFEVWVRGVAPYRWTV